MTQMEQEKPAAASSFFHSSLVSRHTANSQIVMQGGQQGKTMETLHSMLCEALLKDNRLARNLKFDSFMKMSTLLADKDGAFQITLGRGLPAESFRGSLLGWLEFMRLQRVIEILPALEHRGGEIICNDYVIIQEDKEQEMSLDSFKNEALKASIDAAGQWLAGNYQWSQGLADDQLQKKDPTFVRLLPYYSMLEALRSDWHPPADTSHSAFADQMKGKSEILGKVYAALLSADKLKFQTKLPGVKKLGERFPFAWSGTASAMNDLAAFHERLRTVFVRDILMSEKVPGAPRPDPKSPLYHGTVTSEAFSTAYQAYLKSADVIPSVAAAHKMGISFIQHNLQIFSQREEALRADPALLFARNAIVCMLMHCEPVIELQKEKEKAQFQQAVELYVQKLGAVNPPYVDLDAFVRLDKTYVKTETLRKKMIDALRSHPHIKCLEIQESRAFGQTKLILFAYHTSHLENICNRSYLAARDNKDYGLHMNLERIYDCVQDPSRLQPLIKPETYERFLETRASFFVSQMPFFKRLFWKLFGFAKKVDPDQIKDFIKTAMRTELHKAATVKEGELRTEARKEQERIARRAVDGSGKSEAEPDPGPADAPLTDLEPAYAAVVRASASGSSAGTASTTRPSGSTGSSPGESSYFGRSGQRPPQTVSHSEALPRSTAHSPGVDGARHPAAAGAVESHGEGRTEPRPEVRAGAAPRSETHAAPQNESRASPPEPRTPEFLEAPRPGQPARTPERRAPAPPPLFDGTSRSTLDGKGEPARVPEKAPAADRASPENASSGRLSLDELSAKIQVSDVDPDHVQFLKQEKPRTAQQAQPEPDWEQQVVTIGRKMGMDLTEERRLERKKEKELHKRERHALAVKKLAEHKKVVVRKQATKAATEPAGPTTPKHLVVIEIPVKYCLSGRPVRIQFQKKFFKSESFRKEMADFYRKESDAATSAEEKRYFAFLIGAVEKGFSQYLK